MFVLQRYHVLLSVVIGMKEFLGISLYGVFIYTFIRDSPSRFSAV